MRPQGTHASLGHHKHVLIGRMLERIPTQAAMSVEEPGLVGHLSEKDINTGSCAFSGARACWGHCQMDTKTG